MGSLSQPLQVQPQSRSPPQLLSQPLRSQPQPLSQLLRSLSQLLSQPLRSQFQRSLSQKPTSKSLSNPQPSLLSPPLPLPAGPPGPPRPDLLLSPAQLLLLTSAWPMPL